MTDVLIVMSYGSEAANLDLRDGVVAHKSRFLLPG